MARPSGEPRSERTAAAGYLVAGIGIGFTAIALLGWSGAAPSAWVYAIVIGAFLLIAGSLGIAWGAPRLTSAPPVPRSSPRVAAPPEVPVAAPEPEIPWDAPMTVDASLVPALPSTSIPGAYLAALGPSLDAEPSDPISEPPPIAAALPFAAMARPPSTSGGGAESDESSPSLDVELARLRARVRELDLRRTAPEPGAFAVSGGALEIPPARDRADLRPPGPVSRLGPTASERSGPTRRPPFAPSVPERRDPSD